MGRQKLGTRTVRLLYRSYQQAPEVGRRRVGNFPITVGVVVVASVGLTVNLGPRSPNRIDAVMSDEGNTDATVDEAKMACCGRRKAGQRRHGDSEVGKSGSESSHPVRTVREAAWQQGSRAGHGGVEGWARAGGSFSSLSPLPL
jgi:hypothetical protein